MRRPAALFCSSLLLVAGGCLPSGATSGQPPDLRPRMYAALPFDLAKAGWEPRLQNLPPPEARRLLAANGFAVVGPAHGSMAGCYRQDWKTLVVPLVTVDSVIEVFLKDYEKAWLRVEEVQSERLAGLQAGLWAELLARWEKLPAGEARAAGARLLGLAAVGRSLADPGWEPPAKLPAGLDPARLGAAWRADLAAVLRGEGVAESALWKRPVDWSVFKPVGPYARNSALERGYRLSMWWGAQGLRSAERQERLMAAVLAWAMAEPEAAGTAGGLAAQLARIEAVYDQFYGRPDDLPVSMVTGWLKLAAGGGLAVPGDFGTEAFDRFLVSKFAQAPPPRVFSEWQPRDALDPARRRGQGVRLLPPRVTPETEVFARVVDPAVKGRWLPRWLDALAAFGDDRARELTLALEPAGERRKALAKRLDELRAPPAVPARTAPAEPAAAPVPECARRLALALASPPRDGRMPLFMRTAAYRDRGLSAALAAWAGLRELDSPRRKISYAVGGAGELPGVAEPNLPAWDRLIALWQAAERALAAADVELPRASLELAGSFRAIADKQLRGQALTKAEQGLFMLYDVKLDNLLNEGGRVDFRDLDRLVDRRVGVAFARSIAPDAVRWAGKACCPIYAVVEYGGKLHLCRGGVFDYREFDLPSGRSLSREEFRKLMDSPQAPAPPEWTRSYRVEAAPAPAPAPGR